MISHKTLKCHEEHTVIMELAPAGRGSAHERFILWCTDCDVRLGDLSHDTAED